jgi:multiple sugar transport system permease protein
VNRRTRHIVDAWPHLILFPLAVVMFTPILWLIAAALKSNTDFFDYLFFPTTESGGMIDFSRLTTSNLVNFFTTAGMGRALANSAFLSSAVAVLGSFGAAGGGYALARLRFRGAPFATAMVLGLLIIPAPLLLAPTYKLLYQINLLDSYGAIILPVIAPAFGVFLFRQATMQSVPRDLIEAARVDGLSELSIFLNVALPLLRPMLGAFMIIMFLATWNNFIAPQVFLHSPDKMPLAVAISRLRGVYYQDYGLQMAAALVSIAPPLLLFLLLQRDFVSGLTSGAVKG